MRKKKPLTIYLDEREERYLSLACRFTGKDKSELLLELAKDRLIQLGQAEETLIYKEAFAKDAVSANGDWADLKKQVWDKLTEDEFIKLLNKHGFYLLS